MKSASFIINFFAVFYFVLGVTWFFCIQVRCEEISPRPVFARAVMSASSASSLKPSVSVCEPVKFRSLHAKPYHDMFFWGIVMLEIFVAIFYILAGIFLIKRYVLARVIVLLTLSLDVLLKGLVILFMKFGAIPLSRVTHNPNLLQLYFMPSDRPHSLFSAFVSGLQTYLAGGAFYFMGELFYFGFCFYFFFSQKTVDSLRSV